MPPAKTVQLAAEQRRLTSRKPGHGTSSPAGVWTFNNNTDAKTSICTPICDGKASRRAAVIAELGDEGSTGPQ